MIAVCREVDRDSGRIEVSPLDVDVTKVASRTKMLHRSISSGWTTTTTKFRSAQCAK